MEFPVGGKKKKKKNPGNLTAQGFATKAHHPSKAHFRITSLMFPLVFDLLEKNSLAD